MTIKQVYIAGPFIGDGSVAQITRNCFEAIRIAKLVIHRGAYPQLSHALGMHAMDGCGKDEQWWYDATLEQLLRCDAVYMVPGWACSKGAVNELRIALEKGMPVFYNLMDLEDWLA